MSNMNSIVLVLCLVIAQIYGLDELTQATTVASASENLTELFDQTTTELPDVDLIATTYEPLLIPIPTTNPKYNSENIDNNVNDEKSEKFSPNIYAETIFLPVAPKNYRPDLTHESLSRSNKFNLLDFTSYIHPPVLPDLSGNSPNFPKAEKLVDSNLNIDPSGYKRRLKKSKKGGKSKSGQEDHSNYPKPYAVRDENYYPNNFYEYFKNDFYRNHRDRYDIDPQHYQNPTHQQIQAQYYHPGGGNCPSGGQYNLVQQPPPLYYNYALQPIKFDGHPKGRGEAEEEEEEEEDEEEEEGEEAEEEEHQHADDKKDIKEPTEEKMSEKQKLPEAEEEQDDYRDYDEEEVEGDETEDEKKQNLKFRDTEEEERFHLDHEKFRDDREKFRNDNEKLKSRYSDDEENDDDDEDYEEDDEEEDEADRKKKKGQKKSSKAKKKHKNKDEDDEDYEDEEEESADKSKPTKPGKDVEIIDSATTILPPTTQRVSTFKIAPRPPLNSGITESPANDFTTVAGFRKRMNIVQQKLKRLNLLPQTTTPLIDLSTLYPTSIPTFQPRQQNHRYTQLSTEQPFIIHTNEDVTDPKAQYENIAEDAQEQKTETRSYRVDPRARRFRLPTPQIQNNNGASNEQYTHGGKLYNGGVTTPLSAQPENGAQYSQNLYFAPRDPSIQVPNQFKYNQAKLAYNHPTQIQRPQVFPLTPETPNLNPNLIQHPTQARQIQTQTRIKKENYVTQPVNYQTYTQYKRKRDTVPDSLSTNIKYSSNYRILAENNTNANESDVAASNYSPEIIPSGGRRTVEENESKSDEMKGTTVVPDVKKTEDEGEEAAKESETQTSRPDDGRKILNQVKYFQDFFAAQLRPDLLEFGHLCEDPNDWEERFERKDMKDERHQGKVNEYANVFGNGSYNAGAGKGNPDHFILQLERADKNRGVFQKRVRWGDKKGGYGEHYWDLNHHKPKIEDDVIVNVASDKNSNNDNNNNNNKNSSSKIQSAADDHERDDHDGVEQDGE